MGVRHAALGAALISVASCVPAERPTPPTVTPVPIAAPRAQPPQLVLSGTPAQGALMRGATSPGAALMLDGDPVAVAPDGAFILAFDRDAPREASLVARAPDGAETRRAFTVARGDWAIQHIDAPLRGGASDAEFERRRPPELARIVAARARTTDASGWRQDFAWPVTGRISGVFGSQRVYRGTPASYHSGVDVARPSGTPFAAPADGVVVLAAVTPFTLEGLLIILDHGNGLSSAFLHASKLYVREGARVRKGQALGEIGATGRSTGPHLHWGMVWRGARIDPQRLVGPMR